MSLLCCQLLLINLNAEFGSHTVTLSLIAMPSDIYDNWHQDSDKYYFQSGTYIYEFYRFSH